MCHWSWRPTDLRSLPPPRLAVGPSRYTVCFQDMPQHALHSQPARRPVSLCSNRALSNYPPWSLLPNYRCSQSTTPSHCNAPVFSKRDRVPCKSIPNRSLPGKKPPRRPERINIRFRFSEKYSGGGDQKGEQQVHGPKTSTRFGPGVGSSALLVGT